MPRVRIEGHPPFDVEPETSLLEACEAHRVPMDSLCGGFAACNSCRVLVLDDGAGLTPMLDEEGPFLDAPGQRLGCQARVIGPCHLRLDPG